MSSVNGELSKHKALNNRSSHLSHFTFCAHFNSNGHSIPYSIHSQKWLFSHATRQSLNSLGIFCRETKEFSAWNGTWNIIIYSEWTETKRNDADVRQSGHSSIWIALRLNIYSTDSIRSAKCTRALVRRTHISAKLLHSPVVFFVWEFSQVPTKKLLSNSNVHCGPSLSIEPIHAHRQIWFFQLQIMYGFGLVIMTVRPRWSIMVIVVVICQNSCEVTDWLSEQRGRFTKNWIGRSS